MANQTVKDAISIKGTNPQYLVEKIVRSRIYDSRYWKEECFGLTAELLVDKAMDLKSIGGIYGGSVKPSSFLCLILKMLQIQPEKDIIIEFIRNEDFKYVRALGAFYMRLTGSSQDVYKYLEPLYIDYRKMKRMNKNAKYELIHMDEFIDELLHGERVCDVSLPRLQKRHVLEELNELEPRISPLEVNLDENESDDESKSESSEDESKHDKSGSKNERDRSKDEPNDKKRKDDRDAKHKDKSSSRRERYVDYDRPREEDLDIYERRRERSPERSRHHDLKKSRHDSRERDRDRDRDRDRGRERDRDEKKNHSSHSSSSKSKKHDRNRSHH